MFQTPNTPDPDDVGVALDTIFAEYPDLRASSVRHVLGDHTTQKFGAWEVDWIEPQRVQDETQRPRARRQGRDLDRLGLPARRGARVVPAQRGTTRTSRSCSGAWSAARSPAASPATSG